MNKNCEETYIKVTLSYRTPFPTKVNPEQLPIFKKSSALHGQDVLTGLVDPWALAVMESLEDAAEILVPLLVEGNACKRPRKCYSNIYKKFMLIATV